MRRLWIGALWGGVAGIIGMDIILGIGRRAGLVQLNLLGGLARLVTTRGVANTASGGILGFVIHVLVGILWALVFASAIRNFRSRHNIILGIVNGLIVWLLWGIILPPFSITAAPWNLGISTTILTLLSSLTYGVITGYATAENSITV